jgi:uncharacterized protein (DUF2236 family)
VNETAVSEIRRRIQASLQQALMGDEREPRDFTTPRADEGYFGPDSVTWRVHQDASMLIGGIRALLLQSMHPLAMAGVAQHSSYNTDPFGRLRRTSAFVADVSFGSKPEADAAVAMVRSVHTRVVGTAPDGRPYSANDPHLMAWVHHALIDSFLRTHQQYGARPLNPTDADAYVAEQAGLAERMGANEPAPARSVAELKSWLTAIRPELQATRSARDAAFFLLTVPMGPMTGPYAILLGAAISSLPTFVRRGLWLPTSRLATLAVVEPAATLVTKTLAWAMSRAPAGQTAE